MITEAGQREAYEWLGYVEPYEVKHKGWFSHQPRGGSLILGIHPLPPLYTNGQPDMNTWCYEFVPALEAVCVDVRWDSAEGQFDLIGAGCGLYLCSDTDPYAAFSQWREAQ